MAHTIEQTLEAGLLAKGWKRIEGRSSRKTFSKEFPSDKGPKTMFAFLGSSGAFRSCSRNCFTDSIVVGPKVRATYLQAGVEALSSDNLLKSF